MTLPKLPKDHAAYVAWINDFLTANTRAPIDDEIADGMGCSRSYASRVCRGLAAHGLIDARKGKPRPRPAPDAAQS